MAVADGKLRPPAGQPVIRDADGQPNVAWGELWQDMCDKIAALEEANSVLKDRLTAAGIP